jgi:hypothetical protein
MSDGSSPFLLWTRACLFSGKSKEESRAVPREPRFYPSFLGTCQPPVLLQAFQSPSHLHVKEKWMNLSDFLVLVLLCIIDRIFCVVILRFQFEMGGTTATAKKQHTSILISSRKFCARAIEFFPDQRIAARPEVVSLRHGPPQSLIEARCLEYLDIRKVSTPRQAKHLKTHKEVSRFKQWSLVND